ncbi:hypothetical protein MPSEU_000678100 [Mayamaea pseudoterrestris]|nr:hypothetical protein MPSEU_000678100 [Mayamaea pseudoterrestris]
MAPAKTLAQRHAQQQQQQQRDDDTNTMSTAAKIKMHRDGFSRAKVFMEQNARMKRAATTAGVSKTQFANQPADAQKSRSVCKQQPVVPSTLSAPTTTLRQPLASVVQQVNQELCSYKDDDDSGYQTGDSDEEIYQERMSRRKQQQQQQQQRLALAPVVVQWVTRLLTGYAVTTFVLLLAGAVYSAWMASDDEESSL